MTGVRKSSRCIWDTVEEAYRIWERIKSFVPEMWRDRKVLGLNERLRFLRYDPGDYFQTHLDGAYVRDNGERSYITVQVYLNQVSGVRSYESRHGITGLSARALSVVPD
ncbi:hypothetical protein DPMN_112057 [Dreissena polymorpha]|uniref:Prolyl 4-hydroxylase alpha subunit Fe(2+) 2OG dioxygenase domain-containing protein n=1 Tax=Dreissena polymorpha TaxID=45954 RepID=A0A9D4QPM9_DREPO|nr:hypothetical protein DPMN_112057 [Dreissena polymorpha]